MFLDDDDAHPVRERRGGWVRGRRMIILHFVSGQWRGEFVLHFSRLPVFDNGGRGVYCISAVVHVDVRQLHVVGLGLTAGRRMAFKVVNTGRLRHKPLVVCTPPPTCILVSHKRAGGAEVGKTRQTPSARWRGWSQPLSFSQSLRFAFGEMAVGKGIGKLCRVYECV